MCEKEKRIVDDSDDKCDDGIWREVSCAKQCEIPMTNKFVDDHVNDEEVDLQWGLEPIDIPVNEFVCDVKNECEKQGEIPMPNNFVKEEDVVIDLQWGLEPIDIPVN